jgi:ketosteroid isomerase-like protein
MSQENVEIVQDGFSALARGDFEFAVEPGTRRGRLRDCDTGRV